MRDDTYLGDRCTNEQLKLCELSYAHHVNYYTMHHLPILNHFSSRNLADYRTGNYLTRGSIRGNLLWVYYNLAVMLWLGMSNWVSFLEVAAFFAVCGFLVHCIYGIALPLRPVHLWACLVWKLGLSFSKVSFVCWIQLGIRSSTFEGNTLWFYELTCICRLCTFICWMK